MAIYEDFALILFLSGFLPTKMLCFHKEKNAHKTKIQNETRKIVLTRKISFRQRK